MNIVNENFHISDVLRIGMKLIKILEEVHDAGVIHQDIKPDNILIGDVSDLLPGSDFCVDDSKILISRTKMKQI